MIKNNFKYYLFYFTVIICFTVITFIYFRYEKNYKLLEKNILLKILGAPDSEYEKISLKNQRRLLSSYKKILFDGETIGYLKEIKNNEYLLPEKYFLISDDWQEVKTYTFKHNFIDILNCDLTKFKEVDLPLADENLEKVLKQIDSDNKLPVLADGEYFGNAPGVHGLVKIKIRIINNKIENIEFISENESSYPAGQKAVIEIPQRIIETQSFEIDTVSGATVTCNAIINAVKDAVSLLN